MAEAPTFSHAYAVAAAHETMQELHLVASISHRGEAGRAREGILRRFIQRVMPPALGLESGFVIDGVGNVSGQIDLVLYRTDYYPVLEVGGVKHFPVEAVIAVFEIKAAVDSAARLTDALEQIESVKRLDRTGGGTNYALQPLGAEIDPDAFPCQVFGAVISERSLTHENALDVVERFCSERSRSLWPNIVLSATSFSIRYRAPRGHFSDDPNHAESLLVIMGEPEKEPPLSELAVALANLVRVSVPIDFSPSNYFPASGEILNERPLPDDRFPGRTDIGPTLEEYAREREAGR